MLGALVALAISPVLGALAALVRDPAVAPRRRRASDALANPVRGGQWAMSAGLAFSHGANDAQKSVGVIAALMLAAGRVDELTAPVWASSAVPSR